MAVSFIAAGALAANATTTTLPVVAPSCNVDDILIMAIYLDTDQVLTYPADWTQFLDGNGTTNFECVAWKRAVAGDSGATFNVTKPVDDNSLFAGVIYAFRGVAVNGSPIDSSTIQPNNTAATTIAYPTLDPVVASHVVAVGVHQNLTTWNAIGGTNPNLELRSDLETPVGADCSIVMCSGDSDGAATGTRSQTQNGTSVSSPSVAAVFALIPGPTASDDVMVRLGSLDSITGSGLVTTLFTTAAPPTVVSGGSYYHRRRLDDWTTNLEDV